MATFDQLSAEQRAILELVIGQDKEYSELADMLAMPEARVRELARDALVELAPVSAAAVEEDWRGQLADYVLGKQSGAEATATRGHLRRSEAARAWTRSLLDSLEQLYPDGPPEIPAEGSAARRSVSAPDVGRRRLVAAGAVVGILLLAGLLLWPIGLVLGGDDDEPAAADASAAQETSGPPAGVAVILGQGGQRAIQVDAANLDPSTKEVAYQVWLYNDPDDVKSLGGQFTDAKGTYQGATALPQDYARYRFIDVSREPLNKDTSHSRESVLRGRIPELKQPTGDKASVLGQVVLKPPAPGQG